MQAAAALAGGKTFDDLIAERKIEARRRRSRPVTRDKIIDPKVADAAFALARQRVSGVIDGPVRPGRSCASPRRAAGGQDLRRGQGRDQAGDRRPSAPPPRSPTSATSSRMRAPAGETLDEIAAEIRPEARHHPGHRQDRQRRATASRSRTCPAARRCSPPPSTPTSASTTIPSPLDKGGCVWYDVTAVTAPRDRELAEVRDKVVAAWKRNKVDERLAAKANEIRDRLAKGDDIAKIAADLNARRQDGRQADALGAAAGGRRPVAAGGQRRLRRAEGHRRRRQRDAPINRRSSSSSPT